VRWIALRQQGDRTSAALLAAAPSLDTSQAEGMTVTIVDVARPVMGGVDTHLDLNVAPCRVTGGVDTHLDVNVAGRRQRSASALEGPAGARRPKPYAPSDQLGALVT
jgi:hypothetical protein